MARSAIKIRFPVHSVPDIQSTWPSRLGPEAAFGSQIGYFFLQISSPRSQQSLIDDGYSVTPSPISPEIIGTFKVFYHEKGL